MNKIKLTCLFFTITLFISFNSCKEICVPPECQPPDLNSMASLSIEFCTSNNDPSCFLEDDLSKIKIIQRRIGSNDTIRIDTIHNLNESNNKLVIGGSEDNFLKFGSSLGGSSVLQEVEYYYELEVIANGLPYKIENLVLQNDDDECSCPEFNFESAVINDVLTKFSNLNEIVLTK